MSLITSMGLVSMFLVVLFTMNAYRDDRSFNGQQSRRQSIIEAWVNIFIGFSVNFLMNWLLLPLLGAHFTGLENFFLGCVYTLVSIIRQYAIRRWFTERIHNFAARAAESLS